MYLEIAAWAPTEAIFWSVMDDLKLANPPEEEGGQWSPRRGLQISYGWSCDKITPNGEDEPVVDARPGFHANLRFYGALKNRLEAKLDNKRDAEGNLEPIFKRATAEFRQELKATAVETPEAASKFPKGLRHTLGVRFSDMADIKSRSNVWA